MRDIAQSETFTWHLGEDALDGSSRKVNFCWTRGGLVTRFHAMSLIELETEIAKRKAAGLDTTEICKARAQLAKLTPRRRYV
jgi:hypothetical protein